MLKSRWKKVLLVLAIIPALVIIGIILLLNFSGTQPQKIESIPAGELGKKYPPEELRADLDYLFSTFEEVHPNLYAFTSKEKVAAEIEAVKQAFDQPATRADLYQEVAPLVAMLGDGHTYMHAPSEELEQALEQGLAVFPLSLNIERGRAFIENTEVQQEIGVTAGSELVSINDKRVEEIISSFMDFISGEKDSFKEKILENHFSHLLWLVYDFKDSFEIKVKYHQSGQTEIMVIDGIKEEKITSRDRSEEFYTFEIIPEVNAGYIDFRGFVDMEAFEIFLEETFTELDQKAISHLVIDIRDNGGGNSRLGDAFLKYLTGEPFNQFKAIDLKVSEQIMDRYGPGGLFLHLQALAAGEIVRKGEILELPTKKTEPGENPLLYEGEVYLLVSPYTFSSAASFAAAIKYYDLGTLIGEETGGLITTFGDVYRFALPNTRLQAGVSHKRFISHGGEENGKTGVKPDFEVTTTPEDLARGRDPFLDFTRELIRSGDKN